MITLQRNNYSVVVDCDYILPTTGLLEESAYTTDFELIADCPLFPTPISDVTDVIYTNVTRTFDCAATFSDGTTTPATVEITKIEGKIATCTAYFHIVPAALLVPFWQYPQRMIDVIYKGWTAADEGVEFSDMRLKRLRYHNGLKIATEEDGSSCWHIPAIAVRDMMRLVNDVAGVEVVNTGNIRNDVYCVPLAFSQSYATPRIHNDTPEGLFNHVGEVRAPSFVSEVMGAGGDRDVWAGAYGFTIANDGTTCNVRIRIDHTIGGFAARIRTDGEIIYQHAHEGFELDFTLENLGGGGYVLELKQYIPITFNIYITYYNVQAASPTTANISQLRVENPTATDYIRGFGEVTAADILNDYARLFGLSIRSTGGRVELSQPTTSMLPACKVLAAEIANDAAASYRIAYKNDSNMAGNADYSARQHLQITKEMQLQPYMTVTSGNGEDKEDLTARGFTGVKYGVIDGVAHYAGVIANTSSDNKTSGGDGYVMAVVDGVDLLPIQQQVQPINLDNLIYITVDVPTYDRNADYFLYCGQRFKIEEVTEIDGLFELKLLKI